MINIEKTVIRRSLLLLIAVSLVLISARIDGLQWLSILWLLPLVLALQGTSVIQAALLCGACATLFWLLSLDWLLPVAYRFTAVPLWLAGLLYVLICLWQAVPYAVFGAMYAFLRCDKQVAGPWLAAAALTVCWILLPTPIPGLPLHSLYPYPLLLAVLDISGIAGLLLASSLWCCCVQSALGGRQRYWLVVCCLPLLLLAYGQYRHWQHQQQKQQADAGQWLTLAWLQPDLNRHSAVQALLDMSLEVTQKTAPDLLIWPELPPAYSLINNRSNRHATLDFARHYQQDMLVVSGYVYAGGKVPGQQRDYFNRAHLLVDGTVTAEYSKQKLVPFFEAMPQSLAFLRSRMPGTLYYRAGQQQYALPYREGVKLVMAICYEAIFPALIREQVRQGGNILINPVSDTWFGQSAGSRYHFSLAYFRAIEHRIPWVRAANSGISAVVEADGHMISGPSRLNTVATDSVKVFIPGQRSLYSRFGDWLTPLLLLVLLVYIAALLIKKKNNE